MIYLLQHKKEGLTTPLLKVLVHWFNRIHFYICVYTHWVSLHILSDSQSNRRSSLCCFRLQMGHRSYSNQLIGYVKLCCALKASVILHHHIEGQVAFPFLQSYYYVGESTLYLPLHCNKKKCLRVYTQTKKETPQGLSEVYVTRSLHQVSNFNSSVVCVAVKVTSSLWI